jgi:hypothetical protein
MLGCEILSFLDAYSGYHQTVMKESDQLPFGLKNAGATYQRCMQKCFADQVNPPRQPNQLDHRSPHSPSTWTT